MPFLSTWMFPLTTKNEALSAFIQFKKKVETQFDRKIKILQSDWGEEYRSFSNVVQIVGIIFRQSCPYTSAQNGRAERKHGHIVELGLTLLAQEKMPFHYW